MTNSADQDEANWSESTLIAKADYIRAQQNQG